MDIFMKAAARHRAPTTGADRDYYLELVRAFPLKHLRSDRQLSKAIKMIDSLIIRGKLERGEQEYLDVLTDIVEKYETENCPMSPVSDADMVRHLIEARGITQAKLSADVDIPMSSISEVLHGKKKLTRRHIGILAEYFGVDPGVFLG
jgi:HTH-type transcriptional regulator / antitoxin HigA